MGNPIDNCPSAVPNSTHQCSLGPATHKDLYSVKTVPMQTKSIMFKSGMDISWYTPYQVTSPCIFNNYLIAEVKKHILNTLNTIAIYFNFDALSLFWFLNYRECILLKVMTLNPWIKFRRNYTCSKLIVIKKGNKTPEAEGLSVIWYICITVYLANISCCTLKWG